MGKLISLPPNQFPIFDPNQSNPPSEPSAFARIVDPPTAQLPGPDMAKDEAAELQGAGIYNALGVIVVVVAAMDQADQDHASEDVIDAGRMASAIMEHSLSMAPELLLLGLERVKVSFPSLPFLSPRADHARSLFPVQPRVTVIDCGPNI